MKEKGQLHELVDPRLGSNYDKEEAMIMINVALLCSNIAAALRPSMSSVVSMLEGKIPVKATLSTTSIRDDEMKIEAMRKHFRKTDAKVSEIQTQSVSTGPQTAPSASAGDPDPLTPDGVLKKNRE